MTITHQNGSYEVVEGVVAEVLASYIDAFVLTDSNVQTHWASKFNGRLMAIEPGERSKSISAYEGVLTWLAKSGATRSATLVALGGGVVGDLAGFVAATYMRGIRLIQ